MSNTIVENGRSRLTQRATSQSGRADEARRARLILLLGSRTHVGGDPRQIAR